MSIPIAGAVRLALGVKGALGLGACRAASVPTHAEILLLADEPVELEAPPLDERTFFVDALRGRGDIDDVRRTFALALERAVLAAARRMAE